MLLDGPGWLAWLPTMDIVLLYGRVFLDINTFDYV